MTDAERFTFDLCETHPRRPRGRKPFIHACQRSLCLCAARAALTTACTVLYTSVLLATLSHSRMHAQDRRAARAA